MCLMCVLTVLAAAASAGKAEPVDGERSLHAHTALRGHRRQSSRGMRQSVLRRVERVLVGGEHGELGIGRDDITGKPGEQRARGGGLPGHVEGEPVVEQHPRRETPVLSGLGMAHRLDRIPMLGEPAGGASCRLGSSAGAVRRSSSCSRSANRW